MIFAYQPPYGPLSGAEFERQTVAFLESIWAEVSSLFAGVSENLRNLELQVQVLTSKVQENTEAVAALQVRCTGLEESVTANSRKIELISAQIDDMTTDLSSHASRLTAIESEILSLIQTSQGQGENITDLQRKMQAAETDIKALRDASADQAEQIASLRRDVSGNASTISTLTENMKTLQSSVAALQKGTVPTGLIGLYNDAAPPEGFTVCDGQNGTPNLTNYASGYLRYIQKT